MLRQMLLKAPEKVEEEENQISHYLMQPLQELGLAVSARSATACS